MVSISSKEAPSLWVRIYESEGAKISDKFPQKGEEETDSIKWFIEDQTYDLAPPHPIPPSQPKPLNRRHKRRLRKRDNLLTREGDMGVGEEEPTQIYPA